MRKRTTAIIRKKILILILLLTMVAQLSPAFRLNVSAAVYPDALVNGGFEDPAFGIGNTQLGQWWVNFNPSAPQQADFGWNTTAIRNPKFEFGGEWNVSAWGVGFIPEGRQFVELNPTEASAVYQDLITVPGTVIYWSLYQGGVWYPTSQNINNSMAVRIGEPHELDETTMKKAVETAYDQVWTNRTIYDTNNKIIASSIPSGYIGKDSNKKVLYTEPKRWTKYEGVYVVPEGQTLTRFSFASLSTIPEQGNLLDGVVFRMATPEEVETLDSLPPVIGAINGNPSSWTTEEATITFSAIDNESSISSVAVHGSISGEKLVTQTGSTYSFTATQNETYTITAIDNANNSATAEVQVTKIAAINTATFDRQGGSGDVDLKSVAMGSTYGVLPTPVRTGYIFSGWWTAITGGTEVTSSTVVTTDTDHTLYARWTADTNTRYNGLQTSEGATSYAKGAEVVVDDDLIIDYTGDISEASVLIRNPATGDRLTYTSMNGISGVYNQTTGILTLKGTATYKKYEEALRSIKFSTTSSSIEKRVIDFVVGSGLYLDDTGHFYEYVSIPSSITWSAAKTAAESKSFFGRKGYLVTITGAKENEFVLGKTLGLGWIGARDINRDVTTGSFITGGTRNGDWRWVTGPEGLQDDGKGLKFYSGYYGQSASAVPGVYNNWQLGEPNNSAGEWLVHILGNNPPFGVAGRWNDFSHSSPSAVGYIVEYGGLASDAPIKVQDSKEISISVPQVLRVTFDRQEGIGGEDSKSVTLGSTYEALPSPTRAGYTFSGWWTAATGGSQVTPDTMVITGSDHTLYARWTAKTDTVYKVEHYLQDITGPGYSLSDAESYTGETASTVTATAKIYQGFSEATEHTSRITSGSVAADGSLVLKLYYNRAEYTVNFLNHDDSVLKTETVRHGGNATAPADPSRSGYTFNGWSGIFTNVTSAKTIIATYNVNSYTLTFDSGEGSAVAPITQQYNSAVTAPADPVREGYTFTGWNPAVPETMPAENLTLEAKWRINSYALTIDYKTADGSPAPDKYTETINFGAGYSVDSPAVTGYNPSSAKVEGTMAAKDRSVTVIYEPNSDTVYKVEHYIKSLAGSWVLVYTKNLTGTTNTEVAASLKSYEGFSQPEEAPKGKIQADGSTVIRVEYARNSYKVNFDSGEGSKVAPITQQYNSAVTAPADPVREGYTFTGWNPSVPETMPAEDLTLVAKWSINSYALTIDYITADGSPAPDKYTETINFGAGYSVDSPAVIGYTPSSAKVEGTMAAKDRSVTVTYEPNGDTVYKVEHYTENIDRSWVLVNTENLTGTTNTEVAASLKSVEGFSQPEEAPKGKIQADGSTVIRVEYARNSYTLTFDSGEGSAVAPITQQYNSAVTAPADPVREGYTFTGWNPAVPETMPAEDLTLVAKWRINSYALTIDYITADGSPAPDKYTETINFGAGYSVDSPAVIGYTPSSAKVEGTMAAKDRSVTVTYEPNSDTVYKVEHYTENLDGSWVLVNTENLTGTTNTEVAASLKSVEGFSQPEEAPKGKIQADGSTAIRVEYTRNIYTLTFESGEGSEISPIKQAYDSLVTAPADPVREGYTFTGWNPAVPETMPAENLTLEAQWSINRYALTIDYKTADGSPAPDKYTETINFGGSYSVDSPAVTGYTPSCAKVEGTMAAKDRSVTVTYEPNRDTVYKVEHYTENLDGSWVLVYTDGLTGTTNTEVAASLKSYEGFSQPEEAPKGKIQPDGSTVIRVEYTRNSYTLTFDSGEGSEISPIMQAYDSLVTAPADPVRAGYDFEGWYKDEKMTKPWNFTEDKMTADEFILYALWTARTDTVYKVKHYREGLDGIYVEFEEESLTASTDTIVEALNKTYGGFTCNVEHEKSVLSGNVFGDGTLLLELYYDRNEYRVVYLGFDESTIFDQMMKFEAVITEPEPPVQEGYLFIGWDPEMPLQVGVEDVTLKSVWEVTTSELIRQKIESLPPLDEINTEDGDLLKEIKTLINSLSKEELENLDKKILKIFNEASTSYVNQLFTDKETNVSVRASEATYFDPNLQLIVEEIESESIKKEVDKNLLSIRSGKEMLSAYNISLVLYDVKVQPDGEITIYLPISKEFKANYKNLEVIYVADDGKISVMPSRVEGEYLVFETEDLSSYFSIIGTKVETFPTLGEKDGYIRFGYFLIIAGAFVYVSSRKRKRFSKL